MAFSSLINLQLSENVPTELSLELAYALAPVHFALHALHKGTSIFTGAWQPSSAEYSTITPAQTLLASNLRKYYAIAGANINAGQMVRVNASAQMVLADATVAANLARGICTKNVLSGAWGEFVLLEGLVTTTGLTAGSNYYLSNTPGAISGTPGTVTQFVGFALSTTSLYMRINLP